MECFGGIVRVRRRLDFSGGGRWYVPPAAPAPTPVAAVDVDEVAGEEARVGDDDERGGDYNHHCYQRWAEVHR